MIGKVFLTGKSFGETCAYVCERQSLAELLDAGGIRAHNQQVIAGDFEWQHQLMPDKEKPVFHAALTFPPGEKVADKKLVEIGRKYLEKIGMTGTQYLLVKHLDKAHLHVHVVANRVNDDGEPTGKGLIIERSIKAAEELTREYGLRQERGKRLSATRLDALHEPDAKRYRIYQAVQEVLPRCRGLVNLAHFRDAYLLYHRAQAGEGIKGIISSPLANDVQLSPIAKGAESLAVLYFNKDAYSIYCREYLEYWEWVEKRNEARYQNTLSHGKNYDAKNMMHTFRLLNMAEEIALYHRVIVHREDRDFLLRIRSGEFEYEELMDRVEEKMLSIEESCRNSDLTDAPDAGLGEALLVRIREEFYRK